MSTLQSARWPEAPPAPLPPQPLYPVAEPLAVLTAAAALGILARALLWGEAWGLSVTLWVGSLVLVLLLLARRYAVALRGEGRWLLVLAGFFAAAWAWRDSSALAALNLLAALVLLALGAYRARAGRLRIAALDDYLRAPLVAAVHAVSGVVFLLLGEVRWRAISPPGRPAQAVAVGRGVLLAIPLLLLFGILFAAADPVFEHAVTRLFQGRAEDLPASVVWIGFWSWISAGFLRQVLISPSPTGPRLRAPAALSLGSIEAATVLGLLNLLFGAFVLVQLRYLFGGAALVEATVGLSYAEYARRGFFELVAVAALVLPILLALDALVRFETRADRYRFRGLAGVLVALLFLIMASALYRMRLYQSEYGLTEQRLYATVFMGWLAVVFLWLVATVLRGRRRRFAWGALVSGLTILALLTAANPDALIVRANVHHAAASGRFDAPYLASLSADAVPALIEVLPAVGWRERCQAAESLLAQRHRYLEQETDWRSWNLGLEQARQALREHEGALQGLGC